MSKERASPVMEDVDPSDKCAPLLSVAENLPDDVIFINELTPPLPSLEDHLWLNDESGVRAKTVKSFDREAESLFGPEFVSAKVMQKPKHECSECGKGFRTTNALNKHLFAFQPDKPHLCNTCHRRFKHHHHLMAHMLSHKKKMAHCYSKPGCHKVFSNHHSKKCGTAICTEPSTVPSECPHPPAVTDYPLPYNSFHSLFHFPPKLALGSQLEQHVNCESRCSSTTGFASITGNLQQTSFPEINLSQLSPVIQESWSSAAVDSNQRTPVVYPQPKSATVDPVAPVDHEAKALNLLGWEDDLNFPVTNPQSVMGVLTVQPCEEESNTGMECSLRPLPASPKKSQPVLLTKSLQHLKPDNKLSFIGRAQACSKSNSEPGSVASQSHQKMSHCPRPPPPPGKKGKKTTKTANVPAISPPPAIRSKTKRWSRPQTASLISPSQVAMASFSTESTPSLTIKGEGTADMRQGRKESGTRTLLKCLPDHSDKCWPSLPQTLTTSSAKIDDQALESMSSTTQVKTESRPAGQIQKSHGFQLSPLVIPVSVPVLDKEAPFNKQSPQSVPTKTENQQKKPAQDLSSKSHHPDLLRSLIIPNSAETGGKGWRAIGGYPSQLRSPTYLVDHLLKPGFPHPPYTPPPMLSPLRPGIGLYFSTVPHCQPCPHPPFTTRYTTNLDGTDTDSLMTDSTVVNIEPKINVGPSFQAEIPPLRNRLLMLYEQHPAQLVWAPWGDLPTNPETQQRVTEFLNMCCSSVLPGGGTNTELALHCLHKVQGCVLAALDLLLLKGNYETSSHPLSHYHFTGSDHWTAQEMKLFRKALLKHNNNFQLIHNMVQTKSVAQCVEYYYAMKKLKKFKKLKKGLNKKDGTADKSGLLGTVGQDQEEDRIEVSWSLLDI